MSETTREVLDSYQKVFSGDCYKNMEKVVAAVGAACKSLMQVNGNEQIQAWQDALYDPESSINKSIRAWSKYPKQIKIEELAGLQVGLQKLVDYIPQYDIKSLSLLQTFNFNKLFNTDTEIGKNFTETYDYAYETAEKDVGEPDIDKEELKSTIIEEIKNKALGKACIIKSKFQTCVYALLGISITWMFLYLLQEKVDSGFVYFLIDNFLNPTIQNIMCDFIKEKIGVSPEKNITVNIQNVNIGCTFYEPEVQNK